MREKLRERTSRKQCFKPVPRLIGELNRRLNGWANYFRFRIPAAGLPRDQYVRTSAAHVTMCAAAASGPSVRRKG